MDGTIASQVSCTSRVAQDGVGSFIGSTAHPFVSIRIFEWDGF
jgi:hypothetical protein